MIDNMVSCDAYWPFHKFLEEGQWEVYIFMVEYIIPGNTFWNFHQFLGVRTYMGKRGFLGVHAGNGKGHKTPE